MEESRNVILQSLTSWTAIGAAVVSAIAVLLLFWRKSTEEVTTEGAPPMVPSTLPFLGSAIEFGKDPINFLLKAREQYGNVFSIKMVGKTFTYLIGSDSSALFFNSRNEDLNAEEVYSRLVTPVFGKGVAYDVPHNVFLEQKKMLKSGLTIGHFRRYIPMIRKETEDYFKRWGDSGEKDLFVALSELIIMTASRCLHGTEIREMLDERIAGLYNDLDGGFTQAAWLLPSWLPLSSFRRRDRARQEMQKIFNSVIENRRKSSDYDDEGDILSTLINSTYKDGRPLTNTEITGMCIGLLMAGQHTSSSTSSWLGFFLAQNKELQDMAHKEIMDVLGEDLSTMNFEQIKDLFFLDSCVRETLRLRPPIMTMMRMIKTPQNIDNYTIPIGHQACVCPTANQRLKDSWTEPQAFKPDRFLQNEGKTNSEKFAYIPFGAGRHRCIGEGFALVQIKVIWAVLLQKYEFELVNGHFPSVNYQTMIHTPQNSIIKYKLRSGVY